MNIYFDNAATTAVCREAAEAMTEVMLSSYGNPSSTHSMGRQAKKILDAARNNVASALGCRSSEVYFTSGGSEANNWALSSAGELMKHQGKHVISSGAEHDSVKRTCEKLKALGYEITLVDPHENGRIWISDIENALREDTVLVSVMLVNNETGAVNPISEIARLLKAKGSRALLHTDAVQGFLKIPFTAKSIGADMISVSSHKIHGPKGCGALFIKDGLKLKPLIYGGGQEKGIRAGTEAMPAIAGFGKAAEIGHVSFEGSVVRMREIREYIAENVKLAIPDTVFIGEGDAPHILSLSLPGYRSEVLLNYLDAKGICVSKSSACKKGARSHVLEAMKVSPKVIDGAIRISFSEMNTIEEAKCFVSTFTEAAGSIRKSIR